MAISFRSQWAIQYDIGYIIRYRTILLLMSHIFCPFFFLTMHKITTQSIMMEVRHVKKKLSTELRRRENLSGFEHSLKTWKGFFLWAQTSINEEARVSSILNRKLVARARWKYFGLRVCTCVTARSNIRATRRILSTQTWNGKRQ